MPKNYTEKFLISLGKADPNNLGVKLARLCVDAKLPVTHVAKYLHVSRMTVHTWFKGGKISKDNIDAVKDFMKMLELGFEHGELPNKEFLITQYTAV